MAELAALARTDYEAAQRQKREFDSSLVVYDGARLEPAVRHLVKLARKG